MPFSCVMCERHQRARTFPDDRAALKGGNMKKAFKDDLFKEKYEKYSKLLFRIAFLHLGSTQDAEDVLQNVFIKLLYSSPGFRDEEHEKAWLIRVTQNHCKNLLKSAARKNQCLIDDIAADKDSNITAALDISMKIRALPASYKTAIFLCYYEDLTVKEIARSVSPPLKCA